MGEIEDLISGAPLGPTEFGMTRLCVMAGVIERTEGDAVELWRNDATGTLFVRAYNECGNNYTDVDLASILRWSAEAALNPA